MSTPPSSQSLSYLAPSSPPYGHTVVRLQSLPWAPSFQFWPRPPTQRDPSKSDYTPPLDKTLLISPHLRQSKIKLLITDHQGPADPSELNSSLSPPCLPVSSHTGLSVPATCQAHSHPRAFASAVPPAWNAFSFHLHSAISFSESPSLDTEAKISTQSTGYFRSLLLLYHNLFFAHSSFYFSA